jgi:hypothetical protein
MATDLTKYAVEGYEGVPNTHIYSSPAWFAYQIGVHLRKNGITDLGPVVPENVRMGRGYTIHASGTLYEFKGNSARNTTVVRIK